MRTRSISKKSTPPKSITLLPVLRPSFNAREICKELALLERHLNEPQQRCKDCINKHFLTIEALAEEAISLHCPEKKRECPRVLHTIPDTIRRLQTNLAATKYAPAKCKKTAAELRKIRKALMPHFAVIPSAQLPGASAKPRGVTKSNRHPGARKSTGSKSGRPSRHRTRRPSPRRPGSSRK